MDENPRNRSGWRLLLAASLLLAVPCRAASPRPEEPRTFSGETTVLNVEVPVQVLRDGKPVRGLTAENFRVYDEKEPREIVGFETIDLEESTAATVHPGPAPDADATRVPVAARRHFLLLFDLDFSDKAYLVRAEQAAHELVEGGLKPEDLVAVAFFSGRAGVSSVLGFTPDRSQVLAALDKLARLLGQETPPRSGRSAPETRESDGLGMTAGDWQAVVPDVSAAAARERSLAEETLGWMGSAGRGGGGKAGGLDGETIEDMADYAVEDMRQKRAAKASALVDALRALADGTRFVEGQKHLLLFSLGFESTLYLGDGGSWLLDEMRKAIDRFRQTGWVIDAIAGEGLDTGQRKAQREALFYLARETGGTLVDSGNDLSVSMARVLLQTSVTYLLTLRTPELPEDGSFRRLRVELEGVPGRARVIHRAGYFLPEPFSRMSPEERRQQTAELLLSGKEVQELGAGVFTGPLEVDPATGTARVPAVIELGRDALDAEPADRPVSLDIRVYAFDSEERVAGLLAQRVTVPREKLADAPAGLKFFGEIELPGGSYEIRALVQSLETGRVTATRSALEVPAAGQASPLLEPLFVQGPDEHWLLMRQAPGADAAGRDEQEAAGAFPFVLGSESYLPAVHGAVAPGDEARLVVMGYGLPAGAIRVESRVEGATGRVLDRGKLEFLGRDQGDGGRPDQLVLGFAPQGLEPGDYTLDLTLQSADGTPIGRLRAPLRVVER